MKRLNIRLADKTASKLEAFAQASGCSKTAILERLINGEVPANAIAPAPGALQSAQLNRIEDAVTEIVEAVRRKQSHR